MDKYYIAVYGTLKKGQKNHNLLINSKLIKNGHTGPGFSLFIMGLPYLLKDNNGFGCEIEIYEIDLETLQLLDRLEGNPFFYKRVPLIKDDDKNIEIYVLNDNRIIKEIYRKKLIPVESYSL